MHPNANVPRSFSAGDLQRLLYRIAERSSAGLPFHDFLQTVHALLSELVVARNCFVCLLDAEREQLYFAYYVDEHESSARREFQAPLQHGLTEYVLRTGRHQLIDQSRYAALWESGEISTVAGHTGFTSWLGVPMQIGGKTGGVLAVQSYDGHTRYTEAEAEILGFVAHHFGSAIERYQALDALRQSEARYRTVIENVGVGVVVVQDGRMVFANPSLVRIVGHPLEYLLSQPYTATIHPDDVPGVIERHQRRLQGLPVQHDYSFRVITQSGDIRTLELSAVIIDWNQRNATLMFVVDATGRLDIEHAQRLALQHQTELNDLKARFVAMASHEFRTPLAAIHGSVELLRHYEDRMPAEKKQATLQKIDDAVSRMTHMLENVLLIGRVDAGQMEFQPTALALAPFCHQLLDELRNAVPAQFEGLRVQLRLPPTDACYLLDEALMRNIVGNLLSNAVKYSPQGGDVLLSVKDLEDGVELIVQDQGIGIPLADQSALYQSFHRASNVGAIAGTGLGLSIVKAAVDLHGGSISVRSAPGQGSTFCVTLPTRRTTPQDDAA